MLLIPSPWSLTESLQRLVKAQHLVLVLAIDEAWRLLDIHLLLELPVQEHRLDIHMVDTLAVVRCNGEKQPY